MTTYTEFKDEIMKYEQRSRAVSAMLGTVEPPARPAQQPPGNSPATGGRGLAGTGRGGRGRGAVRQIGRGRGGGGGQAATPLAAQDGGHTPGQGADGLPKFVSEIMPHPLWKLNPYDKARMPPRCANGKYPCVLKYYLMQCGRCDKNPATCMFRQEPREQDAIVLQQTRDSDPHYKEFEEALQNSGGGGVRRVSQHHQEDHHHGDPSVRRSSVQHDAWEEATTPRRWKRRWKRWRQHCLT